MERLDVSQGMNAMRLAPDEEVVDGAGVGFVGMAITEIRSEEIDEAASGGISAMGNQLR